jgi:hypothetical protein
MKRKPQESMNNRSVLEAAVGQLHKAAPAAVEALVRNLKRGSPASQVRAAQGVLDQAAKGLERLELVKELAEIKAMLLASKEAAK